MSTGDKKTINTILRWGDGGDGDLSTILYAPNKGGEGGIEGQVSQVKPALRESESIIHLSVAPIVD